MKQKKEEQNKKGTNVAIKRKGTTNANENEKKTKTQRGSKPSPCVCSFAPAMAGPEMWAPGTYYPYPPVAQTANWWDENFNIIAALEGDDAAAWDSRLVDVRWAEHAVQRMFERYIVVQEVADAVLRRERTVHREGTTWPEYTWVLIGVNGVKVYMTFMGEDRASDPVKFVYKIVTVVRDDEDSDRSEPEPEFISMSVEHKINTVLEWSKQYYSRLS